MGLTPPAPASAREGAAPEATIQAIVDGLMPYVARLRGLPWKKPVPAQVLSRDGLGALLEQQLERDVTPEEWARDTRLLRRLGMLGPEEDLRGLLKSMFQAGIEGLYDPETKRMYVVEGFQGEAVQPTIVHELIHALEDQHLDLDKLEAPFRDDNPDRVFALRCVFEGGAEYARRRFLDEHRDVARAYYAQQGSSETDERGQLAMMRRVPAHMMVASLLHYRIGPNFVGQVVGDDYPADMARLFADPPTTQEQCLHPDKWLGPRRDYPRAVTWGADFAAAMGTGWSKLDEHDVGEVDLAVYLDHHLGGRAGRLDPTGLGEGFYVCAMASRAARGWDAGRAYYLRTPGDHLVVIHAYAFDSVAEAREGARYLAAALHRANGKAWKGEGWKGEAEESATGRYYDYVGRHGRGRVAQRGQEIVVLDGVRDDVFDRLWPLVAATTFAQDPRDEGDRLPDPFEGDTIIDERRGLGLKLPGPHWEAEEGDYASPLVFAVARSGSVEVQFTVVGQEYAQEGLPVVGKMVLGRLFQTEHALPAEVMGRMGLVHGLPSAPGQKGWLYVASDLARTYVITVRGTDADVERLHDDIALLLGGCRTGPRAVPGAKEAGLRSIPGY
jgi:hypothetical protein